MSALDNDIIAHEKTAPSAVDGIFCAFHGGAGFLNNWLFENTRLENFQYSLFSITIANNPWGTSKQLGSISTVLIRNLTAAVGFASPTPYRMVGNASENARTAASPFLFLVLFPKLSIVTLMTIQITEIDHTCRCTPVIPVVILRYNIVVYKQQNGACCV